MEDPNEEEWRIQEFRPPDQNSSRLRRLWRNGLNLGKNIVLTGIVVSAAPLALPPLVVLSAFGVAFSVPFGFYFASYAATDKLMSTLLSKPKQLLPPLLLKHEYVVDDEEKVYENNYDKVEEEGYEDDDDLEEEERVLKEDTSRAFKLRIELDDSENDEIQDYSGFSVDTSGQLGIDEDVKDIGDVIVDKFEQDGYEEDADEYMEKEEPIPSIASEIVKRITEDEEEISSMEEGRGERQGNGVEVDIVSIEVGGEDDINVDQVELAEVFGPQVSMGDSRSMEFGDVELEELERETAEMIESVRDEGVSETKNHEHLLEEEPIPGIASEILKGFRGAEEEISLVDEGRMEILRNGSGVIVMSAEVGAENDIDIEQLDVFVPQGSMEDSRSKVKFGEAELEELGRETSGMVESVKDEEASDTINHEHSMEKEEPIPGVASEILKGIIEVEEEMSLVDEGRGEVLGNGVKAVAVSAEVDGENDIDVEQAEEVDVFDPPVSMEDSRPKVKFGDVEPVELERETTGMIQSIKDEGLSETKNLDHSIMKASPFIPDESNRDIDGIQQVFVPSVSLQNDNEPVERKFGDVEPGESNIENVGILELVRTEGEDETVNRLLSVEKTSLLPDVIAEELSIAAADNPEQLKLLLEKETVDTVSGLQELSEPLSTIQGARKNDTVVSMKEAIQDTRTNAMFVIPVGLERVQDIGSETDITRDDKVLKGIGSEQETERCAIGLKGEEGQGIAVNEDLVRLRKLVVHVKKSGDNEASSIESTGSRRRGETLILMRADTGVTSTVSGLKLHGQDNTGQDLHSQPGGMFPYSADMQDLNLQCHERPSMPAASTSESVEGLGEISVWKQINAMRTIVGYEAPAHASAVEELKALYMFTGVEPPASLSEPLTIADVNEKLQFLMAVVGVKE